MQVEQVFVRRLRRVGGGSVRTGDGARSGGARSGAGAGARGFRVEGLGRHRPEGAVEVVDRLDEVGCEALDRELA